MTNRKHDSPSSLIVTQANKLIEARYNLTLAEQRLIAAMIASIQPDDEDFKPYRISIKEFAEFLGISKSSMYQECKKITKKLLTRVVEINEPTGLLQVGWVSSAKYIEGYGIVDVSFDPLLKPYLLQLQGNFTSCKLAVLASFKSQYTWRLYVLLKQYETLGVREFETNSLRERLGLSYDQHIEYSDFKRNIIRSICVELKNKADLYFEFDEIKYGRKVGAIRFRIFKNKVNNKFDDSIIETSHQIISESDVNALTTLVSQLLPLVPDSHRTKKTVISAIETYEQKNGFDYVKRNILYCNTKAEKSYAGFLHNALKNDWGHDWEIEQHNQSKKAQKSTKTIWESQGFVSEKDYAQAMFERQVKEIKNIKLRSNLN